MQRDRNAERECPHCGEQIGGTVHMCPHCRKSLATLDQKEWERASPISRSEGAPPPETSTGLKRLLFSPFAAFTIIAAAFVLTLVFYPGADDTAGKGDIYRAPAPPYGAPPSKRPEAPERHELTTIPGSDAPVSPAKRAAAESAKRAGISEQAVARKRKIKSISNDIFHKLKEEEAVTTDTIYLKSGREMQCTVIDDLGDQLKVRYKGVTTIIEKTDVEQMKRLSQQAVDMRMRRMSLEQAGRIVDQGLVPYGGDWITPEERDIKKQKARAALKKQRLNPGN